MSNIYMSTLTFQSQKNNFSNELTPIKLQDKSNKQPILNNYFTQQLKPHQTVRLQKLKSQLTDYLNKKIVNNSHDYESKTYKSQPIGMKKSYYTNKGGSSQNSKYQFNKNQCQGKNNQNRRKSQFKNRKQLYEDSIEKISRQSFLIKQIKPENKGRLNKNQAIFSPGIGKVSRSYYQIIAIQKNFNQNNFYWRKPVPKFLGGCSHHFQQKYQGRIIINPENSYGRSSENKNQMRKRKSSSIQPWEKGGQSITAEIYHGA